METRLAHYCSEEICDLRFVCTAGLQIRLEREEILGMREEIRFLREKGLREQAQ